MTQPAWLIALLAAVGAAIIAIRSWWRGRTAARERASLEARIARTELERDVAAGEVSVARVEVEVLEDHAERQAAATVVAEEVRDAASAAGPVPADHIAAVDDWVRAHADGDGASSVPDPSGTPTVRRP